MPAKIRKNGASGRQTSVLAKPAKLAMRSSGTSEASASSHDVSRSLISVMLSSRSMAAALASGSRSRVSRNVLRKYSCMGSLRPRIHTSSRGPSESVSSARSTCGFSSASARQRSENRRSGVPSVAAVPGRAVSSAVSWSAGLLPNDPKSLLQRPMRCS
jgi:hypothetical protein